MIRPRPTLATALVVALAGLASAAASVQALVFARWGASLASAAQQLRDAASRNAEGVVTRTLGGGEVAVGSLAAQSAAGILNVRDPREVERALLARLLENPDLAEATFTLGGSDGEQPGDEWQVSVYREEGDPGALVTSMTRRLGPEFVVSRRVRPPGATALDAAPLRSGGERGSDPTRHPTFETTLQHHRYSDAPLWTDLHFAERDEDKPEAERTVLVTVMQAVEDEQGRVIGVARVGLLSSRLDAVARIPVDPDDPHDPHVVLLADERGRLLTRLDGRQAWFVDTDDSVRLDPRTLPEAVQAALRQPAFAEVDAADPRSSARFEVAGRGWVLSVFDLVAAQDWRVGVLVPEDHALAGLRRVRRMVLVASLGALALVGVVAAGGLRSVRRSLEGVVRTSTAMTRFDFAPGPARSPFRDVASVLEGLEQAKTALRAMGRYVPVDLVRELYRDRREPRLGGELRDVTLLFTDIEGFTSLSERIPPDALARLLGRYFEVLTAAVHESGGIVDKYIGDAVMALWGAPRAQADHPARACAAALACLEASRVLERDSREADQPVFRTRLGLHRAEVMVGHFGAPERFAYTALGDGVNVASRLEGLNKHYGTRVLASEAVRAGAGEGFVFRLVDRVAVKGRRGGLEVYELLGRAGSVGEESLLAAREYERAFAAYLDRRSEEALAILDGQAGDAPSRVLAERCRSFRDAPPPSDWDGTWIATRK